ncbi:heterokaryon incompatibility protein-domain-containing protein [Trametes meyenii]|nr:heterokaryon incompatibility protein-domain-containing protein [Trametes meyenii]
MPRFLETHTGQFVWKDNLKGVRYAILSHTWRPRDEGGEQTYQDILELQNAEAKSLRNLLIYGTVLKSDEASTKKVSILSRPDLSEKIGGICKVAREAGYTLVWVDSCCIDKTSSAELAEAINSMFDWYSQADVCYVFLADVRYGHDHAVAGSAFQRSRWHQRGWTLQELLAPRSVVFLSATWGFIGTKVGLSASLQKTTRINMDILTGETSLNSVSVAQKLRWSEGRLTTRIEDKAYSLLGLFGVHMSPIYGEGENAFLRLQQEIVANIPDQSIFCWGHQCELVSPEHLLDLYLSPLVGDNLEEQQGLLAPTLESLFRVRAPQEPTIPLSAGDFASRVGLGEDDLPPLQCVFTPQGVRVQLLCIDLTHLPPQLPKALQPQGPESVSSDHWRRNVPHYLGLLRCGVVSDNHSVVALPLVRLEHPTSGSQPVPEGLVTATHDLKVDPERRTYRVLRIRMNFLQELQTFFSHELQQDGPLLRIRDLTIRTVTSPQVALSPPALSEYTIQRRGVIDIVPWCVDDLQSLGFAVTSSPVECEGTDVLNLTSDRLKEGHPRPQWDSQGTCWLSWQSSRVGGRERIQAQAEFTLYQQDLPSLEPPKSKTRLLRVTLEAQLSDHTAWTYPICLGFHLLIELSPPHYCIEGRGTLGIQYINNGLNAGDINKGADSDLSPWTCDGKTLSINPSTKLGEPRIYSPQHKVFPNMSKIFRKSNINKPTRYELDKARSCGKEIPTNLP